MVSISKLMLRVMGGERVQEVENDVQEVGNECGRSVTTCRGSERM